VQNKHKSTSALIQPYIDGLQARLGLPRLLFKDITEVGGSPSRNDDDITKWWYVFWDGQPEFWISLKKADGASYPTGTLERYMGSIKNLLTKKLILSRYLKVIEETYTPAKAKFQKKLKAKKTSPPKKQSLRQRRYYIHPPTLPLAQYRKVHGLLCLSNSSSPPL
jgi:hypothetical protein